MRKKIKINPPVLHRAIALDGVINHVGLVRDIDDATATNQKDLFIEGQTGSTKSGLQGGANIPPTVRLRVIAFHRREDTEIKDELVELCLDKVRSRYNTPNCLRNTKKVRFFLNMYIWRTIVGDRNELISTFMSRSLPPWFIHMSFRWPVNDQKAYRL